MQFTSSKVFLFDNDGASVLHKSEVHEHENHAHGAVPASPGHGQKRQEDHKGMFPAECGRCYIYKTQQKRGKKGFKMLHFSLPPVRGTFTRP